MPSKNFTARFCETVKVEARTDFQDEGVRGLVLRVSKKGTRTWCLVYVRDSDDSKQRVKIGRFPAMTLENARAEALRLLAGMTNGADPSQKKRDRRAELTVLDLGSLFIEKHGKRFKRSWPEDERILAVEVLPVIGEMRLSHVKRRHILDIIEAKAEAGHIAQSTRILATVRKMFAWAVDNDYLAVSPSAGIKPRGKAVRRDRVLANDEILQIWNALPGASLSWQTVDILKLMLLTGQRSGEICGIRRGEVDVELAIWALPAVRTKNARAHIVPLSAMALEIVSRALQMAGEAADAPLFSRIGEPIESNAISQAVRKKLQITRQAWTPHDVRRTVATGMAGQGVAPHIVESVLNHISGFRTGVAGVYNRHLYENEKRRALDIWAEHLDAIVEGKRAVVVPLVRPA